MERNRRPLSVPDTGPAAAAAVSAFNRLIIDAVHDVAVAVKPQLAFYERLGWPGIRALEETMAYARERGLLIIADGKRHDIGSTAAAYAGEATVLAAADALSIAYAADTTKTDPNLELAHEASLQAAAAKVVIDQLAQKAASQIFDVGGASVVRQSHLLDRHWRNIRTLASHNPASYKAQAIGALYTRGTRLPGEGYF